MNLMLPVTIVIGVPVVVGFIASRKQRSEDRRHRAAFIGFSGAIVAVAATILSLSAAQPYSSPARQGLAFVSGIIGIVSSLVVFVAGFLSGGFQRFALVSCGIAMGLIYLLAAFSNFGS